MLEHPLGNMARDVHDRKYPQLQRNFVTPNSSETSSNPCRRPAEDEGLSNAGIAIRIRLVVAKARG